jgi:nucleoside 2-deoxyribosyltransferase
MKVYIAGSYAARAELAEIVRNFPSWVESTSTWLSGCHDDAPPLVCATCDFADIDRADMVIVFTQHPGSKGGRYVEVGYALAKGKPVVLVGTFTNVFTRLCRCVNDINELWNERTRVATAKAT